MTDPSGWTGESDLQGDKEFWDRRREEQRQIDMENRRRLRDEVDREYKRKEQAGFLPENYQCGPFPGAKLDYLPQAPLWYNFKAAGCFQHDVCYATCGKTVSQGQCDLAFWADLDAECENKSVYFPTAACKLFSGAYFAGVVIAGAEPYKESQIHSKCKDCSTAP